MKNNEAPKVIRLSEYTAPEFLIERTELDFDLFEDHTIVKSNLYFKKNPKSKNKKSHLILNGADLELLSLSINGKKCSESEFKIGKEDLELLIDLPDEFVFSATTKIHPEKNTSLEGLYKSTGMFCTQCEAEGFRKITYYLDRPDVMSVFTTVVRADKEKYPILLSNGNPTRRENLQNGRHLVEWNDPFRKPAYLFALVAGDLDCNASSFTTKSGRDVKLEIYVNKGNADRTSHAMTSLKKSMKWDEDTFGLEYDLDIFMIVAVDDFNFGAMENKGLNIFNSSLVLARADTATDEDYEAIEAVVGHEYFHNWSGNRVTCRDWFQLSLKEGLTVYRDQEFTSDMMSRSVKRIDDVNLLRTHQFMEDAGPMAHPIRPSSYMEINNFYTLTVYEKGAEVIRMIATILGREKFLKGISKYFELFDGQAVTTDDFVFAMEQASGVDLSQFKNTWYSQAGTPEINLVTKKSSDGLQLEFKQDCRLVGEEKNKAPYHIPMSIAVFDRNSGKLLSEEVLHLKEKEQSFKLPELSGDLVVSPLRNFSAPVKLVTPLTVSDLEFLLQNEKDAFARWEASQTLAWQSLLNRIAKARGERPSYEENKLPEILRGLLKTNEDPALLAQILELPSEKYLAQQLRVVDMQLVAKVRDEFEAEIGNLAWTEFLMIYKKLADQGEYRYEAKAVGKRQLRNKCLQFLVASGKVEAFSLAREQYFSANNMSDSLAAFAALSHVDHPFAKEVSLDFYKKWKNDSLVINKWLMTEACSRASGGLERVERLLQDPVFSITNPNKVRAVLGAFAGYNPQFHNLDGRGYGFLAAQIMEIDGKNPSLAARLAGAFNPWKTFDSKRQELIRGELRRIMDKTGLSTGTYEIVSKALNS